MTKSLIGMSVLSCCLVVQTPILAAHPLGAHRTVGASMQRTLTEGIADQIANASELFSEDGLAPSQSLETGTLMTGESTEFLIRPGADTGYTAVGVCSRDCSDLDLVVRDSSGDALARDVLPDDVPIVSFVSPDTSPLSVLVVMAACDGTCEWAVQLYSENHAAAIDRTDVAPTTETPTGTGAEHRGRLERGDAQLPAGEFIDHYTFSGARDDEVIVEMSSSDFDTYVVVSGPVSRPNRQTWQNDDYEGDPNRSLLRFSLPESGEYEIHATSFYPEDIGDYTVTYAVETDSPQGTSSHDGRLEHDDDQLPNGAYVDTYEFNWQAGDHVSVDLRGEFDTVLAVVGPDGFVRINDDFGDDLGRSVVDVDLPTTGQYSVVISSYDEGETGSYSLTVENATGGTRSSRDVRALLPGRTAISSLEVGDVEQDGGRYREYWTMDLQAGQHVTVQMESDQIDSYLILLSPDEQVVQENDDLAGDSVDSRIDALVSRSGRYRVVATTFRPEESGSYTLNASVSSETATADAPRALGGTPEFHGVFVGISDYPIGIGDLAKTAADAQRVSQAFLLSGAMREENSTVLIDSEATVANVRTAFRDVAQRSRPGDSFVFFFRVTETGYRATTGMTRMGGTKL